jgi:N-acetylmuramoyl-L-alanine amidase
VMAAWAMGLILCGCAVENRGDSMLVPLYKGDVDVLARTLYGENRGNGIAGMQSVAWVILNRARDPADRWPKTIAGVCKQRAQFTCWSPNDPNAKVCAAVDERDDSYVEALFAATSVLSGQVVDPTLGSDHYFAVGMKARPSWAETMDFKVRLHGHLFYRSRR